MKFIPNSVSRTVGRQILVAKKNSPHILFGAGVVGAVTSTVLACRATLKLDSKLDDIQNKVADIKVLAHSKHPSSPAIEHKERELTYVYVQGGFSILKLYAPAVIVGAVSIAALTRSHLTMTQRYTAVAAAYSTLATAFDEYRERVRGDVGEERELQLYRGHILESVTDTEGNTIVAHNGPRLSPYAQCFDEFNKHWEKSAENNYYFISCQQNYANHLLRARGHVFLLEVYDMLGFPRTPASSQVGWVMGHNGDDYIDFGMFQPHGYDFVNSRERSIWLDFNVDGPIWNLI